LFEGTKTLESKIKYNCLRNLLSLICLGRGVYREVSGR
jgi:hypothetical protein